MSTSQDNLAAVYISNHPLIQHKLSILRDKTTEPKRFREVVHEITTLLAYEATSDLTTREIKIQTPLAEMNCRALVQNIGLVPILRSGLGMVAAMLSILPTAQVWHIGLYRDHDTLQPVTYYNKLPGHSATDVCLVLDPMLATGGSAVAAIDILKEWGTQKIKYMGLIAAPEGVQNLQSHHPDVPIYIAGLDTHLNDIGYIVPGLGDAGDRQFGTM